jgi:hypothetical protein
MRHGKDRSLSHTSLNCTLKSNNQPLTEPLGFSKEWYNSYILSIGNIGLVE